MTLHIPPFTLRRAPPGLIAPQATWVLVHRHWMYGPRPSLLACLCEAIQEWQHDRHLVG